MITCTPVRRSVSGQGRNLASWLKRTSRTEKPSTSRHCPNSSGIGRFAVLGFAAPVSKTKLFLKSIISMGWDGGFIESVWECYIILGVSVFREHSNLNFSVVGRVPGGILGRIHTWWKSHFPFFLFRLQEGKLVPANITVELLLQVCCRWWFSEIRDGERFFCELRQFPFARNRSLGNALDDLGERTMNFRDLILLVTHFWTTILSHRNNGRRYILESFQKWCNPKCKSPFVQIECFGKSWLCRMLVP